MAPQTAIQEAIGTSQQMFADLAKGKREELVETGQCEPFTIVNFNRAMAALLVASVWPVMAELIGLL